MRSYLIPAVDLVKSFIEDNGIEALYECITPAKTAMTYCLGFSSKLNALKIPAYQFALLLDHWELKEILKSPELQEGLSQERRHSLQQYLNRHSE